MYRLMESVCDQSYYNDSTVVITMFEYVIVSTGGSMERSIVALGRLGVLGLSASYFSRFGDIDL